MQDILGLNNPAPLSLATLMVNLLLSLALSGAVAWFYAQYGRSLSNRARFAQTLPVLAMVTVLIISVVKSSLALSLGLVGALSIVRFRTAIKEPEELIYLFMALAIGLGLGADQRWPTLVAIGVILGYLLLRSLLQPGPRKNNLFFNVTTPDQDSTFTQINEILTAQVERAHLRRLDRIGDELHATYLIYCPDEAALAALLDHFRTALPDGEFSFVEQDNSLAA